MRRLGGCGVVVRLAAAVAADGRSCCVAAPVRAALQARRVAGGLHAALAPAPVQAAHDAHRARRPARIATARSHAPMPRDHRIARAAPADDAAGRRDRRAAFAVRRRGIGLPTFAGTHRGPRAPARARPAPAAAPRASSRRASARLAHRALPDARVIDRAPAPPSRDAPTAARVRTLPVPIHAAPSAPSVANEKRITMASSRLRCRAG